MAAVRRMHIIVPSGATVIMNDPSKYLTGAKSGIKDEVEDEGMCYFISAMPPTFSHTDTLVSRVVRVTWQNPVVVWDPRVGKTTVQLGVESFTGKKKTRKVKISGAHLETSVN